MKIRLGVNLDHVATLRQVRGGTTAYPNILKHVEIAHMAGADQITIHLREDRRHIQDQDVKNVIAASKIPVNLEMAVTTEMTKLALKYKPKYVCLVPEKRQELTTEGGLDVLKNKKKIKELISQLSKKNIKVSTFIGPDLKQVQASYDVGAFACEFHTGHWVQCTGKKKEAEFQKLSKAAVFCHKLGMNVHAGHGLDYETTYELKKLPHLEEVNIGHFLVCQALEVGMYESLKKMREILDNEKLS